MPEESNAEVPVRNSEDASVLETPVQKPKPILPVSLDNRPPPPDPTIGHIREHLEDEERGTSVEVNGFTVQTTKENFGRGDVEVMQIVPPGITTKEAQKLARKQIYIPGYDALGANEQEKLLQDMLVLAEANKNERDEPVIVVGVAYTGRRENNARLAEGLPVGVEVTQFQVDKAHDLVDATNALVEDNNAEVIGFSLGGSIAQLAVKFGLHADTVGLFNTAGLYKEKKEDLLLHKIIPEKVQTALKNAVTKVGVLVNGGKVSASPNEGKEGDQTGALVDRLKRSRVEHWGAYRSITHPLLGIVPETQYIVANGKKDSIYPLKQVRGVLSSVVAPNVQVLDLEWEGHGLGGRNKQEQRKERLIDMSMVMQEARQTAPSRRTENS